MRPPSTARPTSCASPLLETTINGATNIIINVSGDVSLIEANDAASYVQEMAGEDANIIFGAMYDEAAQDECTITVIATGLEDVNMAPSQLGSTMGRFARTPQKQAKPAMQQRPAAPAPAPAPQPVQQAPAEEPAPAPAPAPQPQEAAPQQEYQSFVPRNNRNVQITIPDFLKNRK